MFIVFLHVAGFSNPFGLRFRTEDAAQTALRLSTDVTHLLDDFGQHLVIDPAQVSVRQVLDIALDLEAQGVLAGMQQRKQGEMAEAAQRAQMLRAPLAVGGLLGRQ